VQFSKPSSEFFLCLGNYLINLESKFPRISRQCFPVKMIYDTNSFCTLVYKINYYYCQFLSVPGHVNILVNEPVKLSSSTNNTLFSNIPLCSYTDLIHKIRASVYPQILGRTMEKFAINYTISNKLISLNIPNKTRFQ